MGLPQLRWRMVAFTVPWSLPFQHSVLLFTRQLVLKGFFLDNQNATCPTLKWTKWTSDIHSWSKHHCTYLTVRGVKRETSSVRTLPGPTNRHGKINATFPVSCKLLISKWTLSNWNKRALRKSILRHNKVVCWTCTLNCTSLITHQLTAL